jgi:thiosulfate/3-mercaptopyruvate sulfurtransferase
VAAAQRPMAAFVTADDVLAAGDQMVLADVRWSLDGSQGRKEHLSATIPGAVFVDLDADLAAPPSPLGGRHPLPDPEVFAVALGRLGIGDHDPVVAFDQGPGTVAARLVWMLRVIGQPAAVLDGGLAAWPDPLAPGGARRPPVTRTAVPWPADRLADADLVASLLAAGAAVLLDAREPARYRGEHEPVDARPGHVPGAVNLPTSALVRDGRLVPPAELRRHLTAVDATSAEELITSCGSGVTACFDALVLEELGIEGVRLFPGSWSAWSADRRRPAATGPDPWPTRAGGIRPAPP